MKFKADKMSKIELKNIDTLCVLHKAEMGVIEKYKCVYDTPRKYLVVIFPNGGKDTMKVENGKITGRSCTTRYALLKDAKKIAVDYWDGQMLELERQKEGLERTIKQCEDKRIEVLLNK